MKNEDKIKEEQAENEEKVQEVVTKQEFDAVQEIAYQNEEKYKRAIADYQNLQKRVTEEKGAWVRAANRDVLLRLLPVLDTLMLAEKHLKDKAVQVSINHFLDILKAEGVTRIKTVGEMFDPYTMECLTTEQGEEGKVLEELRAGYLLYDKVLRAAQVKVGKSASSN